MVEPPSDGHAMRPHELSLYAEHALVQANTLWASSFGTGSRAALCESYARRLRSNLPSLALRAATEDEHRATYGADSLARELRDERERDAAVTDDAALIAYESKWSMVLAKLQKTHSNRWRLRGLSDAEARDELTLQLIFAIRTRPEDLAKHHRPGKEWGLLFLARARRALAEGFRLDVVLTDLPTTPDRRRTEEERLIEEETESAFALASERAERALSRPQRRWFAAMKMTANAGTFFEASGKLNLAAVSRSLDKNRSSAHRAFAELQSRFALELEKLED